MATSEPTQWEQIVASEQDADCPLALDDSHVDGCDDAAAEEMERIADAMIASGVERRLAVRAAMAVFQMQSGRDGALARGVVGGVVAEGILGATKEEASTATESVRMMALKLVQAPKPRFSAGCLLLAMGVNHDGLKSARDWAEQQSVSHELAARDVADWSRMLALPPTAARKSEKHKKIYRDTNGRQRRAKL
jgi:hypothetical protein